MSTVAKIRSIGGSALIAESALAPVMDWTIELSEPTVLVADDDEGVRDLISLKLSAAGFRTIVAQEGTEALDLAYIEHPDVVILDVAMPGLDGLSVCYELHSSEYTAGIPVLMLSGMDRQVDIDLGRTVGADDYMLKPVHPPELLRRVRRLMPFG